MKFLAIDTSTEYLSLGISEEREILFARKILLEKKHSADLLPILGETLLALGLTIQQMDCFIVGLGPGSFTGLRVGISMVKAMALGLGKPVVGVPTLEALAFAVPEKGLPIVPLIDAKRQKVYAALFEREDGILKKRRRERVVPPEEFLRTLKKKTLFVGGGAALYRQAIEKALGKKALFTDASYDIPDPAALVALGTGRFMKKELEDPYTLVPLYIYPKDCMIKK